MNKRICFPCYDAPDSNSGGGTDGSTTNLKDDISFLNEESSDVVEKDDTGDDSEEEKDKKAVTKDEEDLGDGEEEEEEEETEEQDEENTKEQEEEEKKLETKEEETKDDDPVKQATYNSIKKKYPNFFKDFPNAKNQLFGADAFRRVLGVDSVEAAKEFKEQAEEVTVAFNSVKEMVEKGEVDNFLSEVKGIGEESYKNFVANFMPALYGNDKDTYYSIATPIVRTAIKNIYQRGLKNGGKKGGTEDNFGQNLVNASIVLHHALFESDDVEAEDKPLVASGNKNDETKKDPEKEKFEKERNEFYSNKYNTLKSEVNSSITSTIKSEIKKGLNSNVPTYVLNKLVDDIFNDIDKQVGKDDVHINAVNALWKNEQKAGFTGKEKERIINAVLSRARPLIPVVRKRIATEALKDFRGKLPSSSSSKNSKDEKKSANSGSKQRKEVPNLRDTSKYSDADILNMD